LPCDAAEALRNHIAISCQERVPLRDRSKYHSAVNLEAWTILARVRDCKAFFGTRPTIDELLDHATSVERLDLTPTELAAQISLTILERIIMAVAQPTRAKTIEFLYEEKANNFQSYSAIKTPLCRATGQSETPELMSILGFSIHYLYVQEMNNKISTLRKTRFLADVGSLLLGNALDDILRAGSLSGVGARPSVSCQGSRSVLAVARPPA
jgi:hypothetical protein